MSADDDEGDEVFETGSYAPEEATVEVAVGAYDPESNVRSGRGVVVPFPMSAGEVERFRRQRRRERFALVVLLLVVALFVLTARMNHG